MKFLKQSPFNLNKTEIDITFIERDSSGNETTNLDCSFKITNKTAAMIKEFFNSAIKSGKKLDLPDIKKLFK